MKLLDYTSNNVKVNNQIEKNKNKNLDIILMLQ
jgi:hypothetical protein